MKRITIHLFDLHSERNRDLEVLLRKIHETPKPDRWRDVGGYQVALLEISFQAWPNGVFMDFVKRRPVGPGKVKANSEVDGFDFEAGEDFGEETSALWDPKHKWLAVQYNQNGVRAHSITTYLNSFEHDPESDWISAAVLDASTQAKLKTKQLVRAATISASMTDAMTEALRDAGQSLGDAFAEIAKAAEPATIEITLGMSHKKGFLKKAFSEAVTGLRQLAGRDDGLHKLKIKARATEDGPDEVIDLLKHRIKSSYSSGDLKVHMGRYTVESRWTALGRVHAGWVKELG